MMTKLQFAESENVSVEAQKKALRARMKARRADNENRDVKETLLTENTLAVLETLCGERTGACMRRNVFVYLSFSSEAPTDKLIEALLQKGFSVFCPRVEGGKIRPVLYGEDQTLSCYGIREPIGEIFDGEIHFVITPFLAVDEKGNRLGYGGGYYDGYFKENPQATRIAYGFDFQVQRYVPTTANDEKVDRIVTDKRVIYTGNRVDK